MIRTVSASTPILLLAALAGCASSGAPAQHGEITTLSAASSPTPNAVRTRCRKEVCTRCNPALVPKFKAAKDWCAEHGVPESQCFECHPDLTFDPLPPSPRPAPTWSRSPRQGEDVPALEPHAVTGKVTLFDFYAVWCAPCRKIDAHVFAAARQARRPRRPQAERRVVGDAARRALPEERPEPALRRRLRKRRQARRRGRRVSTWPRSTARSRRRAPNEHARRADSGRRAGRRAASRSAAPRLAQACAGCRNPSLPDHARLPTSSSRPASPRASAILTATSINVVHEAGCADLTNCHEVPVQPLYLHDQDIYPGELRAVVELGLSRRRGASRRSCRFAW